MKLRLPSSRALLAWLLFAHGFLPIVKCNLISNSQEFSILNTADANSGSSDETFPADASPPNNALPPDNAFPPNNDAFPPNNAIAPVNVLPHDNFPGQSSFPSDHNQPDPNPPGFNHGLPLDNSPSSDNGKSLRPIMPSDTNDSFITGTMISQGMPLGTPIDWSGNQGTPVGTAKQPKPTVDPKVGFFLPWIPSGSSFVNLKDGSTSLFQPSNNWQSGEMLGAANFGVNSLPPMPIKPTVSKPSGPISNTMPMNPKPITPIQIPKPIGPVVINTLPTDPGTPSEPSKLIINTGINPTPINTGAAIPLDTVDIINTIPVGPINMGGIPLGTVDIQTGSSSPKGTGSIPKVTEAPIPVSPTCEILGQVTLRNMGLDKKENAMLRRQCAEERKQARKALKQHRQQLKAQNQLIKAAKQEQKQIQLAVKQGQKAVQQEVRAAKQKQRQITMAAKQEQKVIRQNQKAAKQEERVALKAFKQDHKGARPVGVVDLSVEKVPSGQAKVKGNQKPKGGQGGGKKGGGGKVKDPKVMEPKKMTRVELVSEVTPSPIPDMSQIENIPGFGMIDWSG